MFIKIIFINYYTIYKYYTRHTSIYAHTYKYYTIKPWTWSYVNLWHLEVLLCDLTHGYFMERNQPPFYPKGSVRVSVEHILLYYFKYSRLRYLHFVQLPHSPLSLEMFLSFWIHSQFLATTNILSLSLPCNIISLIDPLHWRENGLLTLYINKLPWAYRYTIEIFILEKLFLRCRWHLNHYISLGRNKYIKDALWLTGVSKSTARQRERCQRGTQQLACWNVLLNFFWHVPLTELTITFGQFRCYNRFVGKMLSWFECKYSILWLLSILSKK